MEPPAKLPILGNHNVAKGRPLSEALSQPFEEQRNLSVCAPLDSLVNRHTAHSRALHPLQVDAG
jgi:hypothetical protein